MAAILGRDLEVSTIKQHMTKQRTVVITLTGGFQVKGVILKQDDYTILISQEDIMGPVSKLIYKAHILSIAKT